MLFPETVEAAREPGLEELAQLPLAACVIKTLPAVKRRNASPRAAGAAGANLRGTPPMPILRSLFGLRARVRSAGAHRRHAVVSAMWASTWSGSSGGSFAVDSAGTPRPTAEWSMAKGVARQRDKDMHQREYLRPAPPLRINSAMGARECAAPDAGRGAAGEARFRCPDDAALALPSRPSMAARRQLRELPDPPQLARVVGSPCGHLHRASPAAGRPPSAA